MPDDRRRTRSAAIAARAVATPQAPDVFLILDASGKPVKWQVAYAHRSLLNCLTGAND
jgi:hypothetical protein